MKHYICVAIPIKTGNSNEIQAIIQEALNEKPDFIELRFDYINEVKLLTNDFIKKIISQIQPIVPVILTFRDFKEGGQLEIDKNERLEIIKRLIGAQPNYIDVEVNSEDHVLSEVISLAIKKKVTLIFSYHDFEETPSYYSCLNLIKKFKGLLVKKALIDSKIIQQSLFKLIFTARTFEDNLTSLKICKTVSNEGQNIICFCMGELGIFSRILCVQAGSFLTFGSFEEKTAPGQLSIRKIREIHQLLFD